jgi:hypothetical protein
MVETLLAAIGDTGLRPPVGPVIGSVDQWCDNVDLLTDPARRVHIARTAMAASLLTGHHYVAK